MNMNVPIRISNGLRLDPTHLSGVSRVVIEDASDKMSLSWDRFVRLKRAAEAVIASKAITVLDAGGYDGAIAYFLDGVTVDVIDPATTGGSVLRVPAEDCSYDAVVAVDVLEHIEPTKRSEAIGELTRVGRHNLILNYPCLESKEAQELILKLTDNELIREHVEWELPDTTWVLEELAKHGFSGTVTPHTSIAVWLGQFLTLNLMPEVARELNLHLVTSYADEPSSKPLYHLIVGGRR
jgi:hypothetical protein